MFSLVFFSAADKVQLTLRMNSGSSSATLCAMSINDILVASYFCLKSGALIKDALTAFTKHCYKLQKWILN